MDSILTERGLREPFFRVVRDGAPVGGMTRSAVAGSRTVGDLADPERIRTAYDSGATIVLQSLQRLWPPIGEFCRELAARLGHRTQCNAYVTPGGHAQGFTYHHDTHDVFVLQVAGRKRWQVHEPVLELPTPRQARAGSDLVRHGASPVLDVVLEAGDALYLPRGWVHAAATVDEPSIHLTIGMQVTTWLDLLRAVVERLGPEEPALRRAVPTGGDSSTEAAADLAAALTKQAVDWLSTVSPDAVADVVEHQRATVVPAEPLGPLAQAVAAAGVAPATVVRPRQGLRATLVRRDQRAVLRVPGKEISLPAVAEPMVRTLLGGPVTPLELAVADPDCDVSDALVVVRRLLREGVLALQR